MTAGVPLLLLFVLVSHSSVELSTQSSAPRTDGFLGPAECLERKFTRESCDLMFCPPWQKCVDGRCVCKPAYQCPTEGVTQVCGHSNLLLRSYCQAMALSCATKRPVMSHFGETCTADQPKFGGTIEQSTGVVRLSIPGTGSAAGGVEELLVCPELWDTAAANVACRANGHPLGAASVGTVSFVSLTSYHIDGQLPGKCVNVRCQGYENSLAECVIYDKTSVDNRDVATATCIQPPDTDCQFRCVNRKCVSLSQTCDGVDDCGDHSDEMCCKNCRNGAFRCSTGVCLHKEAVGDGQIDCLDGEDESKKHTKPATSLPAIVKNTEYVSPKSETKAIRAHLESKLSCGVPQTSGVNHGEVEERGITVRVKRVVGGRPTRPTQIQWQLAVEMDRRIVCGGAYIGGCWAITAAHCFGNNPSLTIAKDGVSGQDIQKPNPAKLVVKFSLWKRTIAQASTDLVPVRDVHIHPRYNPNTRENDIALLRLKELPFVDQCLEPNSAVSPVCLPWTTRLFHPNHTCTISGWGQDTADRRLSQVLQWGNVSLIDDCQSFHNDSFKPGMICAGDLDGSVDASQGDDGGPLVCEDELGVSYLWGVVSWVRGFGQPRSPGVYTQVAHYFEWIRYYTGWPAVTKFNS